MSYDYRNAVLEDVKEYIENEIELTEWKGDREGLEEKLNDDLWTADVTIRCYLLGGAISDVLDELEDELEELEEV